MKHSHVFLMSCVALLSFCILLTSCDSSISDNADPAGEASTNLFQNWVVQEEEPDFFLRRQFLAHGTFFLTSIPSMPSHQMTWNILQSISMHNLNTHFIYPRQTQII